MQRQNDEGQGKQCFLTAGAEGKVGLHDWMVFSTFEL